MLTVIVAVQMQGGPDRGHMMGGQHNKQLQEMRKRLNELKEHVK
ncbi:MAG: hypothetical protein WCA04_02465 [Geobacteraceae bacterium]